MKITLLGTGDTTGVPVIGCHCPTCTDAYSNDKNKRTRFSILVESDSGKILIDTSPDMKWQLIANDVSGVDGVIWTHGHYDHFAGFPEFYRVQKKVDVYGVPETLDYIMDYFHFLKPRRHDVQLYEPFELIGLTFVLFEVNHLPIKKAVGVMVCEGDKKVVITGDTNKDVPQKSMDLIHEPSLLVVDAIVPPSITSIKKHMNATQALDFSEKIKSEEVVFVHMSHFFKPHDEESKNYPLGYDGMKFEI
ncbi:MBL fold metallo-hydrolase [Methanohalobium sp.]|uniref:MBL fold metallo-hydrolase n=1 Tax=Methanohalobium sp. TaxID=2837493 RepID=UPI0025ED8563|nr:MBL fold metallo-hydrolase [Methanohalobium sp.]